MNNKNKNYIIFIILFIVVFMAGIYIGHKSQNRSINNFYQLYADSAAVDLRVKVRALTLIRNDRTEQCERLLELSVDNDISYFNTVMKTRKYPHNTDTKIHNAIAEAKRYREQYPYHTPREDFAASVKEAFQNISSVTR